MCVLCTKGVQGVGSSLCHIAQCKNPMQGTKCSSLVSLNFYIMASRSKHCNLMKKNQLIKANCFLQAVSNTSLQLEHCVPRYRLQWLKFSEEERTGILPC